MATAIKDEKGKIVRVFTPDVDILERENDYLLTADMPGVDESSLDVTLEKSTLTIYGSMKEDAEGEDSCYVCSEFGGGGDFKRVFHLGEEVNPSGIKATVKDGVLSLTVPKAEDVKPKKIEVTG